MAPKKKKKGRSGRSKTPAQTAASDPNPTTTSPFTSAPTGGATTTSLVPSSAFPSAPPTTTTTTHGIPSAPSQLTSLRPSSTSQITINQPLPSASSLSIQETHQESTSCTLDGSITTDLAGPSTAPSASAESTRTPTQLSNIRRDIMRLFTPALVGTTAAVQSVNEEDMAGLQEIVVAFFGLQLDEIESVVESLLGLAEKMLAERRINPDGSYESCCSCSASEGEGGDTDGGSGEGDGEGGGASD